MAVSRNPRDRAVTPRMIMAPVNPAGGRMDSLNPEPTGHQQDRGANTPVIAIQLAHTRQKRPTFVIDAHPLPGNAWTGPPRRLSCGRMKQNEPISRIMSTELVTVHHGDPISKVRHLMQETGVHHIPVVNGETLVGIVSWSDILNLSFGQAFGADERAVDAVLDHSVTLEQAMKQDPVTLPHDGYVRQAAEILVGGGFHSLPVVSGDKLVGMVTSTDLIKYLLSQY
jgi:CBS domain-containing protein